MESKMTRGVPGIKNSSLQFIPAYLGYKLYLVNSEHQMNTDTYPISLVDAIQRSTSFEASWIADSVWSERPLDLDFWERERWDV
jgi:hypothetical protein